jgi:hypothetical protein
MVETRKKTDLKHVESKKPEVKKPAVKKAGPVKTTIAEPASKNATKSKK